MAQLPPRRTSIFAAPPDARWLLAETNQPCAGAYDLSTAAALPAGLLIAAFRDSDGALFATQYFVRVGVGGTCDDGGLSFCGQGVVRSGERPLRREVLRGSQVPSRPIGRGVMPVRAPGEILDWQALVTRTAL